MKHNPAADFLPKYPGVEAAVDKVDKNQYDEAAVALTAVTVSLLNLSGCASLDKGAVFQAALEDPGSKLLVTRVTDWD